MKPSIIIISGPSAAGKTFLVDEIRQNFPNITEIIGLTTRPKRKNEKTRIGTIGKSGGINISKGIFR